MDPHATQAAFGGQPKTCLGRPGVRRDFIRGGADAAAAVLHTVKNQFFGRNQYIVLLVIDPPDVLKVISQSAYQKAMLTFWTI